jgi:hypothetical protein
MLSGYGAAAANAAEFQAKFGISVSQDVSDNVERANDAVGRLGMVFEGLGTRMAGIVAPAIEATANGLLAMLDVVFGVRTEIVEFFGSLEAAKAALGEDIFNRMLGNPQVIVDNASALSDLAYQTEEFKRLSFEAGQEIQLFNQQLHSMGLLAESSAVEVIIGQMETLRQKFIDGEISAEEFLTKMDALRQRALDIATSLDGVNGISFGPAIAALGSLGVKIAEAVGLAQALRAALPGGEGGGETVGIPVSNVGRGGAGPGGPLVGSTDLAELQAGGGTIRNMPADVKTEGGGGGGLQDHLAQRLEVLMEGLQTEAEVVAEWYAEQQMTLEEALAAKMLTEAEYMEARERLEQEHQSRLGQIRQMANESNLSMVLGAGQEILSAIGQNNKKAMKVAKVFGAAQALISTYQGAAEALKLPFPKNLAAAAAVIAKGIGFVNAIKGVNDSGGGGASSGGGGGGGGGSASQQNLQTMNFSIVNDSFGIGENIIRQIVGQINTASRNGSQIRANVLT